MDWWVPRGQSIPILQNGWVANQSPRPRQTRLAYSRTWHHVSATKPHPTLSTANTAAGEEITPPSLGRLASRIAVLLMGKHKPIFDPSTDCGDYVVVTDAAALNVTGRKFWQKQYHRHSTRPGSLKTLAMDELVGRHGGAEVLRKAVSGMLPKNRLRDPRLARLKVFEGDAHPYKKNLVRFGGKVVGGEGWDDAVKALRDTDKKRL